MDPDEARFEQVLLDTVKECIAFGYRPARFLEMMKTHGPLGAVRTLLDNPDISDGFGRLLMAGRLDLTAEAIALRPEWQRHFTDAQKRRARQRLEGTPFALPDV